jgi:hypothetical protein
LLSAHNTVCIAYFLVFGTQRDVFRAWCFWRKDHMDSNLGSIEKEAETAEHDIVTSPISPPSESAFATLTELGTTHESLPTYSPMFSPCTASTAHYSPRNVAIALRSTRPEPV